MKDVVEGKEFNFSKEEEKILQYWKSIDAFKQQNIRNQHKPLYNFYDGPPFATGLPHYGHLLAGTVKDIVTRYASTTGYHVPRRFGWDCHGLPVEYEIDKSNNITSREQVLEMGIDVYNEKCRAIVMRYSQEWQATVERFGRWIDFENDYKTMNLPFMESVWWVFKTLYEKELVYKGYKVMPYSTACTTPLSNFEANSNYKDASDPAIMVEFPLLDDKDKASILAWTTTPWTIPSNLALCLHPDFTYVKLRDPSNSKVYIVAESRVASIPGAVPKKQKASKKDKAAPAQSDAQSEGFNVIAKFQGKELCGAKYTPPFDYFKKKFGERAFRVVNDTYVTSESGTGIVHQAPFFGEDDMRVCYKYGIIEKGGEVACPVDPNGRYTSEVPDFVGQHVKEADKQIMQVLKQKGALFDSGSIVHSTPFCWRSDTPLIYKAVPSWFVSVEKIKSQLLHNNLQTHWVPREVQEKRFHNWIENAHDWAISRSRFWGTPIPIWTNDKESQYIIIGSKQELEELTGAKVNDLHRHFIDNLEITVKGEKFRRIDDVFDCWFESGSMPYAQAHYPFENKAGFEKYFPAQFVAEGLDQTRGWFYTLMVISTAVFGKPAFKNLICHGLVLAADGKKMSKRLKNYPDPKHILDCYGADSLRLYLINSPVVKAEQLRFKEEGVRGVVRDVLLPWYNAYRFFVQNVQRLENEQHEKLNLSIIDISKGQNVLDRWVMASTRSLINYVRQQMNEYRLYTVVPYVIKFLEQLTNVYVRFNRNRLKGKTERQDCQMGLASLYYVLLTICKVMAPFTPFFVENIYQNLKTCQGGGEVVESIHFCDFPDFEKEQAGDKEIQDSVDKMVNLIELGRICREKRNISFKQPLREIVIAHSDDKLLKNFQGPLNEYIIDELNVRTVITVNNPLRYGELRAEPDWQVLGKLLGKDMGLVGGQIKKLSSQQVLEWQSQGSYTFKGKDTQHKIDFDSVKMRFDKKLPPNLDPEQTEIEGDGEIVILMDLNQGVDLQSAGIAREAISRFQKLRKKAGLTISDVVQCKAYIPQSKSNGIQHENGSKSNDGDNIQDILLQHMNYISDQLGGALKLVDECPQDDSIIIKEQQQIQSAHDHVYTFEAMLCKNK